MEHLELQEDHDALQCPRPTMSSTTRPVTVVMQLTSPSVSTYADELTGWHRSFHSGSVRVHHGVYMGVQSVRLIMLSSRRTCNLTSRTNR